MQSVSTPRNFAMNSGLHFVFVCQAGELEIKALLLAASLRRFLRLEHELIAAVPTPASTWGELSTETLATLDRLGVRIKPVVNPVGPQYGIGNKLACLELVDEGGRGVFLDSDILLLRELGHDPSASVAFAAKPADLQTYSSNPADWQPLYAALGMATPTMRLPSTVSAELGLPYFNSGVVFTEAGKRFGAAWTQVARQLLAELAIKDQGHWLDQVSLALTIHKLGLDYACLDERYNFPAHLKRLPKTLPYFCHYHWPGIINREPILSEFVRELASQHDWIHHLMQSNPEWAPVLEQRNTTIGSDKKVEPVVLIGGIPGSGSASVLQLITDSVDGVQVDEPSEVTAILHNPFLPWKLTAYLQQACQAAGILPGARVLAVKNDLAFLCRLNSIKRVCPEARLLACVRDPYETIAAWKTSGDDSRIEATLNAIVSASWLPRGDADNLQRVLSINNPAEKRAGCWWWLAQRLLNDAHGVHIIRHGEVLQDPRNELASILGGRDSVLPATHRFDQAEENINTVLDDHDRQAIRAMCAQTSLELGLLKE